MPNVPNTRVVLSNSIACSSCCELMQPQTNYGARRRENKLLLTVMSIRLSEPAWARCSR